MAKLTGAEIMARALKDQGVEYMFGIVGFPVQPIAAATSRRRSSVKSARFVSEPEPSPSEAITPA